ncbi:MAG: hypothetical protein Kow0092_18070 [Deferrisomatales bacterium]
MGRGVRAGGRSKALVVLLAILWAGTTGGAEGVFRLREPGEPLPAMRLYDLAGKAWTLEAGGDGVPTVLFFWSVYCPNCKEAMPDLVRLWQRDRGQRARVWAINVDGDRFSNAVRAYVKDMALPFPVLYDRLDGDYLVAADPLGVSRTPTLYVADGRGRIALRQVVQMDFDAVRRVVDRLVP